MALLLGSLCACHYLLAVGNPSADQRPGDAGVERPLAPDVPLVWREAGRDRRLLERPVAKDAAHEDRRDRAPDSLKKPDGQKKDVLVAKEAAVPTGACATNFGDASVNELAAKTGDSTIRVCKGPWFAVRKDALARCNTAANWHLCTVDEYASRIGKSPPLPAADKAWIAGCINVDIFGVHVNQDLCSSAGAGGAPTEVAIRFCPPNDPSTTTLRDLAIWARSAAAACWKFTDATGKFWESYWEATSPTIAVDRVLCCK